MRALDLANQLTRIQLQCFPPVVQEQLICFNCDTFKRVCTWLKYEKAYGTYLANNSIKFVCMYENMYY